MFLDQYQKQARSTAIYPQEVEILYPALGLADEFGELVEKIQLDQQYVAKEMGDILWYVANLACDLNLNLSAVVARLGAPATRLMDFQKWTDENRQGFTVPHACDFMSIKIGAICGLVKKLYRDDDSVLTDERKGKIATNLAWTLAGVSVLSTQYGLLLTDIAEQNLHKLAGREVRGTLHGDGDER